MKTYIVNLPESIERKKYMQAICEPISSLEIEFVEGIDGRKMQIEERNGCFNVSKFAKRNSFYPRPGEIGCTLSHQKCYRKLLDSKDKYVLILEDDIVIQEPLNGIIDSIERLLDDDKPTIVLLSGWFWYSSRKKIDGNHYLANVVDGYLTHAYAVNRQAAYLMLDKFPYFLADDWALFKQRGIRIFGFIPHPIDQDWSGVFKSVINNEDSESQSLNLRRWIQIKKRMLIQRILKLLNHFEPAMDIDSRINNFV